MKKKDENSTVHIFDTAVSVGLSTLPEIDLFDLHNRLSRTAIGIVDLAVTHFTREGGVPEEFDTILLHLIELLELTQKTNKEVYRRWRTKNEQAA